MTTPQNQSVSDLINDLRQAHATKTASATVSASAASPSVVDPVSAAREKIARAAQQASELRKQASAAQVNDASPDTRTQPGGRPLSNILPVAVPDGGAHEKVASAQPPSADMELHASLASAELMGAAVFDGMLKRGSQYIQGRQIRDAQLTKEANVANEFYKVAQQSAAALDAVLSNTKQASDQANTAAVASELYKVAQQSASALAAVLGETKQASEQPDPADGVTAARQLVYQATQGRPSEKLAREALNLDIGINNIYQEMLQEFDNGIAAATQVFG